MGEVRGVKVHLHESIIDRQIVVALGDINDLQLVGTLGGVEMGLRVAGVPHKPGGVQAAVDYLAGNA